MKKINAQIVRKLWIDFFAEKNHYFLDSLSLVPQDDNSLLFVNSGIAAIKKYFLGNLSLPKNQVVNCQQVVRTKDIEVIGETLRHHTFFEMLGNFSINSYFKHEAITMAFEFLTECLQIDKKNLFITVFEGDSESFNLWHQLLQDKSKIIVCGKDRNFWDMGCGPCGPCTEIYYDRGEEYDPEGRGLELLINDIENERYLEIWNIVFSEFINNDGVLVKSPLKNIDTGAGLERLLTVLEGTKNNFETSLFFPIIQEIEKFCNQKYSLSSVDKDDLLINRNYQIITDHLKAVVMMINNGVLFGNKGREYVVRKLFRKSIVCAEILKIKSEFLPSTVYVIIETMIDFYPSLQENKSHILSQIQQEYQQFEIILKKINLFLKQIIDKQDFENIEYEIFTLVERYGIPIDLIREVLKNLSIPYSEEKYQFLIKQHKEISNNKSFVPFTDSGDLLVKQKKPTEFIYGQYTLKGAQVVGIYSLSFEELSETSDECYLLLDKTIFFPEIAGQSPDIGTINQVIVSEVIKKGPDHVLHRVQGIKLELLDTVNLKICKENRDKVATNHTTEHLLYGLLRKYVSSNIDRVSAKKTKLNFGLSVYSDKLLSNQLLTEIIKHLCHVIEMDIKVETQVLSYQEAKKTSFDVEKLVAKNKGSDSFRVVTIGEFSSELCIGTHVNNTKEIPSFLITSVHKKGERNYEFSCLTDSFSIQKFLVEQSLMFLDKVESTFKSLDEIVEDYSLLSHEERSNYQSSKDLLLKNAGKIQQQLTHLNWLITKEKMIEILEGVNEVRLRVENLKKKQVFSDLKNQLVSNPELKINILRLQNFNKKEIYIFLKEFKFINNLENVVVFNTLDKHTNFYICGVPQKSEQIFDFLKRMFKAVGGGNQMITGNIAVLNDDIEEVIREYYLTII